MGITERKGEGKRKGRKMKEIEEKKIERERGRRKGKRKKEKRKFACSSSARRYSDGRNSSD